MPTLHPHNSHFMNGNFFGFQCCCCCYCCLNNKITNNISVLVARSFLLFDVELISPTCHSIPSDGTSFYLLFGSSFLLFFLFELRFSSAAHTRTSYVVQCWWRNFDDILGPLTWSFAWFSSLRLAQICCKYVNVT